MKEIRITIRSDDFAAVSASMVRLGVGFQVEPVEAVDTAGVPDVPVPPKRRQVKRKSTKTTRRSGVAQTDRVGSELSGAARLRAMAERNRVAAGGGEAHEEAGNGLPGADRSGPVDIP